MMRPEPNLAHRASRACRARGNVPPLALRAVRTALLALAMLGAASCASTPLPPHFLDPQKNPPPGCGPRTHLAGVGTSRASGDEAGQRARAEVIRQLGSHIESELRVFASQTARSGSGGDVTTSEERIIQDVRESSAFSHGELIAMLGAPVEHDGEFWALACLDRASALGALQQDAEVPMRRFATAADRAREAFERDDLPGFASAFRVAQREGEACVKLAAQIRALGGRVDSFEARWGQLFEQSSKLRASISFGVSGASGDVPSELSSHVMDLAREILAGFGREASKVEQDPTRCSTTYRVEVEGTSNCRWGSLGHACSPRFRFRTVRCATGSVALETTIESKAGVDPRDRDRALKKAVSQLTREKVESQLHDAFAAELPLW